MNRKEGDDVSKYYAIKNIDKPKIVRSWEECQKLTKGVSGVLFKSFKTEQEALANILAYNSPITFRELNPSDS